MTTTHTIEQTIDTVEDATRGRGPLAPRLAVRMIDRLTGVRPATVTAVRFETPTVVAVDVTPPDGYHYAAGQYALLRLDTDDGPDFRPLSFASAPGEAAVRFATRMGPSSFKRSFAALTPGATVKLSRPMGSFALDHTRPAVFVAGGIGITPVRSLLLEASGREHDAPLRLLYRNRSVDEAAYRDELDALAARHDGLDITWLFGNGDQAPLLAAQLEELPDAVFYLSGPAGLVADAAGSLRHLGVPRRRIRMSKQSLPVDRARGRRHP